MHSFKCLVKTTEVVFARDLLPAELPEMIRHPLGVQQEIVLPAQPLHQMDEGHLAGIGLMRKHRLSEEGPPQRHPVEPALQALLIPALHGMGEAGLVQVYVTLDNHLIDPGLFTLSARFDHLTKGGIAPHLERLPLDDSLQTVGNVETIIEGNEPTLEG